MTGGDTKGRMRVEAVFSRSGRTGRWVRGLVAGVAGAGFLVAGCGVYSPYGAQTSGAATFSVTPFEPLAPLATATAALTFTESLRDRVQRQSTLRLVDQEGDLRFEADIVGWSITPINIQGNETAAGNRLTIQVRLVYENTMDEALSFERTFSRFADYTSTQDLLSVEDALVEDIAGQISQDIFNATLGNW